VSSLSLTNIAWSTPDGRPLFSGLSLDFTRERAGIVRRNGVGKTMLLRLLAGEMEPERGVVSRSGTIGTMRQLVQVSPSETVGGLMGIANGLDLLRRAEAGTASIDELAGAHWTLETRAAEALAQVGLDVPPDAPLVALSGAGDIADQLVAEQGHEAVDRAWPP